MRKILLVDDDEDMLILVEKMLIKQGLTVMTISDGKQVLAAMNSFLPDLVILDINLGDTDGREICHSIKLLPTFSDLPIILYSAQTWPDLSIADCKANAFIQKPFSQRVFLEKIEAFIAA
jgi:DNA-binding response OmpR family regulator